MPKSASKRSCALTRSDDRACGGSDAPSASRPPRSSAGSKKAAAFDLEETLPLTEASDENKKVLELDELCSFVYRKSDKEAWVWLALCPETRQEVVAFGTGDRSRATCERLWEAIPESYKRATCSTAISGKPNSR